MSKKKKIIISIIILLALIFLWAIIPWSHLLTDSTQTPLSQGKIITVKKRPITTTLYFAGIIKPLKTTPVVSPVDGIIKKQLFNFGDPVKKGQLLFILSSETQHTALQTAIFNYLTAKHNLNKDKTQLQESKLLYDKKLLSRNDYESSQDTYFTDKLAVLQAESQLKSMKYLSFNKIEKLSPTNLKDIHKVLSIRNAADDIKVTAPIGGIALFVKTNNQDSNDSDIPSNHVKEGDVMTVIGDLSGIAITIKIDESNLLQIHPNQKAIITNSAIPNLKLNGYISNINSQASNSDSSNTSIPTFLAKVNVPHLTAKQRKNLHVGMSAKVAIKIPSTPKITVPLNAVKQDNNNQASVQLVNPKTHEAITHYIVTGKTQMNSVIVLSGLHEGDQIVAPN